jgi:hypothetical protein
MGANRTSHPPPNLVACTCMPHVQSMSTVSLCRLHLLSSPRHLARFLIPNSQTMPPKPEKAGVFARLSKLVKGRGSRSSVGGSQGVAEAANTGSGLRPPHDSSTPSTIPLPLANNPTTSNVQGSVSQMSMRSSTDEHQQIESLRPKASATCLTASLSTTPINREAVPQSLIHSTSTVGGSNVMTLDDPQDRLPPSHSPQTPSLAAPPPISLFEGAHGFQMRDFIHNVVFNEVGTQQSALEIRKSRTGMGDIDH